MSQIGLLPAELAALVLETLFTGVSLVLYYAAFYVLIYKKGIHISAKSPATPFNKVLFVVTVLLLLAGLAHWTLDVVRAFDAFVYDADHGLVGALMVFANISNVKNVVRTALYIFQVLLVDCVMVYRLFIIFNRNKLVIIFPCLSILAFTISGIGTVYEFSKANEGTNIFTSTCGIWIQCCFICSLVTNSYACPMIGLHIWWTKRQVKALVHKGGYSMLSLGLQIIIESATLYAIFRLTTLVFYLTESNAQYPTLDATCPAIGIIFCLVTVRSELGLSHEGQFHPSSSTSSPPYDSEKPIPILIDPFGVPIKRTDIPTRHPLTLTFISDLFTNTTLETDSGTGETKGDDGLGKDDGLSGNLKEKNSRTSSLLSLKGSLSLSPTVAEDAKARMDLDLEAGCFDEKAMDKLDMRFHHGLDLQSIPRHQDINTLPV